MKKIIICCLLLSGLIFAKDKVKQKTKRKRTPLTQAQKLVRVSKRHFHKENYNLSLYYFLAYLKKEKEINEKDIQFTERILKKTGTLPLYLYDIDFLNKIRTPSVAIHMAHFYFKEKKYKEAVRYAGLIDIEHNYYPESQLLIGSSLEMLEDKSFFVYLDQCIKSSDAAASKVKDQKFRRYFVLTKEQCVAVKARNLFRFGKYKESTALYEKIDKRSYSWPYILLEKAWNQYHLQDYNRALGITMTYQSPLLESYFFPEAEVLKALSYYQLCLYEDASALIDKFFKVYKARSATLVDFIKKDISKDFYFKLINEEKNDSKEHPYILNLRNQLKKKLRVNLHLSSYKKAIEEFERVKTDARRKNDIKFLTFTIERMEEIINKHVKEYFYFFINQINYFSYEMFNIKLDIITRKKDLLYENKELIATRARGDLSNVQRKKDEFFFTFNGAFWADELGDYSFGLKSNCQSYKKEGE